MKKVKKMTWESKEDFVLAVKEVARRYGRGEDQYSLAKELGVSPSRVRNWATKMRVLGVDIPRLKQTLGIIEAVNQLRSESPELFRKSK